MTVTAYSVEDTARRDPIFPFSLYVSDYQVKAMSPPEVSERKETHIRIRPVEEKRKPNALPAPSSKSKSVAVPFRNTHNVGEIDLSWMDTSGEEDNNGNTKPSKKKATSKKKNKRKAKSGSSSKASTPLTSEVNTAAGSESEGDESDAPNEEFVKKEDSSEATMERALHSKLSIDAAEFIPEAEIMHHIEDWVCVGAGKKKNQKSKAISCH